MDDITVTDYQCCGIFARASGFHGFAAGFRTSSGFSNLYRPLTGTITGEFGILEMGFDEHYGHQLLHRIYKCRDQQSDPGGDGPAGGSTLTRTNYIISYNLAPRDHLNALSLLAEGCTNGVLDPGETVTFGFGLKTSGVARQQT